MQYIYLYIMIYPYTQHHLGERLEVCRFAVVFFSSLSGD